MTAPKETSYSGSFDANDYCHPGTTLMMKHRFTLKCKVCDNINHPMVTKSVTQITDKSTNKAGAPYLDFITQCKCGAKTAFTMFNAT